VKWIKDTILENVASKKAEAKITQKDKGAIRATRENLRY